VLQKVSVIIPLYLGKPVIGPCLDSVLREDRTPVEVIVVDDASPDGAGTYVSQRYPKVAILTHDRNLGYAAAVNRGIDKSTGDVILLLNQDVVVQPGAVNRLLDRLQADETIWAVAPQLLDADGSIQRSCRMLPLHRDVVFHHLLLSYIFSRSRTFSRWKMGWFSHNSEELVEQPSFSAIMIRRDCVRAVGSLDERFRIFFNDVDYCKRIKDLSGRVLFYPSARMTHLRGQATGQIPIRKIVDSHSGFVKYFWKHQRSIRALPANLLVTALLLGSGCIRVAWNAIRIFFTSREPSS
jgi:hypothetical protein